MGFYGNITNTSNTTFSFDKIYPNRLSMDAGINNDNIFIGRYVLVEYQEDAAYPVAFHKTATNTSSYGELYYFYSSPNKEDISKIKYLGEKQQSSSLPDEEDDERITYEDGFYKGEILQYYNPDNKEIEFFECFIGQAVDKNHYALFKKMEEAPPMKTDYIQNFEIDENHYSSGSKGFRGYDSTVWTKVSEEKDGKLIAKYVHIADLNSVVPTFDITADAPTMTPITPHFDADSTNVYYKLHAQPQWGFRIAQTSANKSDEETQWVRDFYDPNTDTITRKYASSVVNGIPNWSDNQNAKLNAAIYFNEDGFKKQLINTNERQGEIKKHSGTITENTIKVEPTGKSGIEYNAHNGKNGPSKTVQVDTQELTINLPAIGNMMSDAWDIIHGPNRDNARTDDNGSLQGRLDSFKAFYDNQIPVKIQDGTLVGSKINNAIKYDSNWEGKPNDILYDTTTPNFERDDAWIKTEINTSGLKTGDKNSNEKQEKNSGISIHHTFHATASSTSAVDKNEIEDNIIKSDTYKEDKILSNNLSNIGDKKDFIELYTPYVDATGHVVGKNIETITLPYGYKTIITNGRGEDTEINTFDKVAAKTQNIVAENTQDELAINSGNEWIRIDTDATNDILTISHDIHKTSSDSHDTDWTKTEANTTIPTTSYKFDNAGHYISHHTENYKLPFGYGKIVGDSGSTEATATFDELTISADDNWIATSVSDDQVNITHTGPVVTSVTNKSNVVDPNFGSTFIIEDWYFDDKGHKHTGKTHTIQFPKGSLNDLTATGSSVLTGISMNDDTGDITQQNANVGTLTLAEYTQGESGRLTISDTNTINGAFKGIQDYINTLDMSNTSSTQFITKITQTDGQVAVERAAAGTLQLGTPSDDGTIPENSSLNNAFNITNARFKVNEDALARETQDRKDAITKEINDRNTAISSAISAIVDKDDDGTINKLTEVIEWINNNPSTATQMQKAIQDNTKAISDEANLARSEEGKITTAIGNEKTRAEKIEQGLQEQIDVLQAWKETATDAISQLQTTIENLQKQIDELKNPPQQPDNSGDEV